MKLPAVEARLTLTVDGRLADTETFAPKFFRWRHDDALLTQKPRKPLVAGVLVVGAGRTDELRKLLAALARDHGVRRVICGGEPPLLKALVGQELLSRLRVVFVPVIEGGACTPTLLGPAATAVLPRSVALKLERFTAGGGRPRATYRVIAAKK